MVFHVRAARRISFIFIASIGDGITAGAAWQESEGVSRPRRSLAAREVNASVFGRGNACRNFLCLYEMRHVVPRYYWPLCPRLKMSRKRQLHCNHWRNTATGVFSTSVEKKNQGENAIPMPCCWRCLKGTDTGRWFNLVTRDNTAVRCYLDICIALGWKKQHLAIAGPNSFYTIAWSPTGVILTERPNSSPTLKGVSDHHNALLDRESTLHRSTPDHIGTTDCKFNAKPHCTESGERNTAIVAGQNSLLFTLKLKLHKSTFYPFNVS